jgi:hypothetical protein
MHYIANIITQNPIKIEEFIKISNNFNDIDLTLPTLIIGWDFVKSLFPDKHLSILDDKISENLYWTFSKHEKRTIYEESLNKFYNLIIKNIDNNIKYYYCNILTMRYNMAKKLILFFNSDVDKDIYISQTSFVYAFCKDFIIGFSLYDLEYIGVKRNKVLHMLYNNKCNDIFYDTSFLSSKIKEISYSNKIIIPYIHSLNK